MDEVFNEAMSILTLKQWADLDFAAFWHNLKDDWGDNRLLSVLLAHPEVEEKARKYYEKVTPRWFVPEELDSPEPELIDRAFKQLTRIGLVYGFICGYVIRIKDAGE